MKAKNNARTDSLDFVRARVAELRDLELEKTMLEERLAAVNKRINHIAFESLVDVMNEKRVPKLQLDADGNKPPFLAEVLPYYRANIAASWEEERRLRAFEAVEQFGGSDIIKTTVTFSFPRGEKAQAIKLINANKRLLPRMSENIPHTTLTAWVRERIEGGKPTPPLDVIGAQAGQYVKIKRID
jgi:hypothetical protein